MIRASQTIYIVNSGLLHNRENEVGITKLFVKRVETSGSVRTVIGDDGKRRPVSGKRICIFDRWFYKRSKAEAYLKRIRHKRVIVISSPIWNPGTLTQLYSRLEARLENSRDFVFVPWEPSEEEWKENELKRKVFEQMEPFVPAIDRNTNEFCYLRLSKKATAALNKLRGTGINYRR